MNRFSKHVSIFASLCMSLYGEDLGLYEAIRIVAEHCPEEKWNQWIEETGIRGRLHNYWTQFWTGQKGDTWDINPRAILKVCEARITNERAHPTGTTNDAVCEDHLERMFDLDRPEDVAAIKNQFFTCAKQIMEQNESIAMAPSPEAPEPVATPPSQVESVQEPIAVAPSPEAAEPATLPPPQVESVQEPIAAAPSAEESKAEATTAENLETKSALTSVANAAGSGSLSAPGACLNLAALPVGDWVYYTSLASPFQPLLHRPVFCECAGITYEGASFFTIQPHYTFSDIRLNHIPYKQNAPGVSVQMGNTFAEHWVISGLFDYGRSSAHWLPASSYTKDTTNRWLLAPSIAYCFQEAYIQFMLAGMYNDSHVRNHLATSSVKAHRWGIGSRLEGGINVQLGNSDYWLQPYVRFDYLATFQKTINLPNVVYVKDASFFLSKGVLQFFHERALFDPLHLITQGGVGFVIARTVSRTNHVESCDAIPSYPGWNAAFLTAQLILLHDSGLAMNVEADGTIGSSVQIYNGVFTLGWNW